MGVTGLWDILSELFERKDIKYLCGKRVAVDLSGWIVESDRCKGLNTARYPHMKILSARVSHLLLNGVLPIFVLEGKMPDIKKETFKKRNCQEHDNVEDVLRLRLDERQNECQEFLKSLGVPCIKSSGEGEALCAILCAKGIVEGVITNDSDAFVYGADTVYKDFSSDPKDPHIKMYSLKSTKNKLQLNQRNLIAFSLLLGCDYIKGVPGIGKEATLKLFKELEGCDLLQRFQDWRQKSESEIFPGYEADMKKKEIHCKRCSHLGSITKHNKEGCNMCDSKITCNVTDSNKPCTCNWHKNDEIRQNRKYELKVYTAAKCIPNFPDVKVIEEYLNFKGEIPDEDVLDWKCPDFEQFQDKALEYLNLTFQPILEKYHSFVTSWQQFKLSGNSQIDEKTLLYKPIKILRTCKVKGEVRFNVQWISVDADPSGVDEGKFDTVESVDRFKKSYPKIVAEYYNSEKKPKPQPKSKSKKMANSQKNRKMTDYFSEETNTACKKSEKTNVEESGKKEKRTHEQNADDDEPDSKKQYLAL